MKKVLILTTRHDCNDNRVYQKEVISLAKNGFNVFFIAPNNIDRKFKNVSYLNIKKNDSLFKRLLYMNKVFEMVKSINPQVVHIQDIELLPLLLKIKKKMTKVITIYDVHEDYRSQMLTKTSIPRFARKIVSYFVQRIENKANKKIDHIVCADSSTASYFNQEKTIVLFNYPKLSDYDFSIMESDIKKRNKYDLIFPGSMRVFTYKTIVDIVADCYKKGFAFKCCIISPFKVPGGKNGVLNYIDSKKIPHELFELLDPVPPYEVQYYLACSKIGLLPLPDILKLQKNIPTKLFEYMIEYLPIIGSDLKPSRHFVKDGETGFLVRFDNIEDYSNRIIYLLQNPCLANKMGENGHSLVMEHYSWETEEKKLLHLYESLNYYE